MIAGPVEFDASCESCSQPERPAVERSGVMYRRVNYPVSEEPDARWRIRTDAPACFRSAKSMSCDDLDRVEE